MDINSLTATESVTAIVTRGAETWQFFAFVFAAVLLLIYGLLEEIPIKWFRIVSKVVSFVVVGYFTLLSPWGRNILAGLLGAFKKEWH